MKQEASPKIVYDGAHRTTKRHFAAAKMNRLTAGWAVAQTSADSVLRGTLKVLRARSRELAVNNDYAKRFFSMVRTNVVGHNGIGLQMHVVERVGKNGEIVYDDAANRLIEEEWWQWGKKKHCSVDGRFSWIDIQQLVVEAVAKDGEALVRKVRGRQAGNPFGFALQLLEADHLDDEYNADLPNGNRVRMGIESNHWGRPVAYHIFTEHPGDNGAFRRGNTERERIPAEDMIHLYLPSRIAQSRGVPWTVSAMARMNMLGGYEEAELVAARAGASKMGFFITPDGEYTGEEDAAGNLISEAEPGTFEVLPEGMDFKEFSPDHPNAGFDAFVKAMLRGAASGLGVSYNALANDLQGVNFSSLRQGNIWERDAWRILQKWLIEHLMEEVFESWLLMALTVERIPLPVSKFEKFNNPVWRPRGWMWVDPVKEVRANLDAIAGGLKSGQSVASESGEDIEEIYSELAREQALREKYGIKLGRWSDEPLEEGDEGEQGGKEEA